MSTHLILLLACMFGTFDEVAQHDTTPRNALDYVEDFPGGMNSAYVVRNPLRMEHVEQWAQILGASDAQFQFMLVEYEYFVTRHNDFMDREMPRHLRLGIELSDLWKTAGPNSPEVAAQMKRVDRSNSRIRRQIISLEESFINAIEPILTPEQHERVIVLRHDARRRHCRTFSSTAPWIAVELREIWRSAVEDITSPAELARVAQILAEYEGRLTSLVCQRADLASETRKRLAENRIARERGLVTAHEGRARYQKIMEKKLDASLAIRELNERTVERIVDAVSEEVAAEFRAAVKRTVFRELYPDRTALHMLFHSLTVDDELDDENKQLTAELFEGYESQHQQKCEELEAMCIEWGDNTEAGITGYEPQFLPDALKPLLEERTELSREYLLKLIEHFGSDVLLRHEEDIPRQFLPLVRSEQDDRDAESGESGEKP